MVTTGKLKLELWASRLGGSWRTSKERALLAQPSPAYNFHNQISDFSSLITKVGNFGAFHLRITSGNLRPNQTGATTTFRTPRHTFFKPHGKLTPQRLNPHML
jgi:hypothetical protein